MNYHDNSVCKMKLYAWCFYGDVAFFTGEAVYLRIQSPESFKHLTGWTDCEEEYSTSLFTRNVF